MKLFKAFKKVIETKRPVEKQVLAAFMKEHGAFLPTRDPNNKVNIEWDIYTYWDGSRDADGAPLDGKYKVYCEERRNSAIRTPGYWTYDQKRKVAYKVK